MKKKLLMAASIICLSAFSTDAFAGCDGIYLAARGGIVNHNLGNPDETFGDRYSLDDNEMMFAGGVGYRWGYFRFEAEYTWRDKVTDKPRGSMTNAKRTFQTDSYMANIYYDLSPYTMFTPYGMVGIGWSEIEFDYSRMGFNEKIKSTEFTWAVGGGISAAITNRFNVDVGYRFWHMGKVHDATVRAHEFYMGLRYVF